MKSVTELCEYAAERNAAIAIESVNRFEGYPGFANTIQDSLNFVEEIGADNLGVLADLFHNNIEEASLPAALRLAGDKLMHVHLADSNRMIPGSGHIDFKAVVAALKEIGFDGYIALDAFPVRMELERYLEHSIQYMKSIEQAVELQGVVYSG